jgi:hypothetical protein
MAALAILAIALVSLYDAHARGLRAAGAAGAYAEARLIAQALLADAQAPRGRAPVASKGRQGRFWWSVDTAPEGASWAIITPKPKADSAQGARSNSSSSSETAPAATWQMYRIHVTVGWDRNRSVELETLKLGAVRG